MTYIAGELPALNLGAGAKASHTPGNDATQWEIKP
jgi:hypothetical protein